MSVEEIQKILKVIFPDVEVRVQPNIILTEFLYNVINDMLPRARDLISKYSQQPRRISLYSDQVLKHTKLEIYTDLPRPLIALTDVANGKSISLEVNAPLAESYLKYFYVPSRMTIRDLRNTLATVERMLELLLVDKEDISFTKELLEKLSLILPDDSAVLEFKLFLKRVKTIYVDNTVKPILGKPFSDLLKDYNIEHTLLFLPESMDLGLLAKFLAAIRVLLEDSLWKLQLLFEYRKSIELHKGLATVISDGNNLYLSAIYPIEGVKIFAERKIGGRKSDVRVILAIPMGKLEGRIIWASSKLSEKYVRSIYLYAYPETLKMINSKSRREQLGKVWLEIFRAFGAEDRAFHDLQNSIN